MRKLDSTEWTLVILIGILVVCMYFLLTVSPDEAEGQEITRLPVTKDCSELIDEMGVTKEQIAEYLASKDEELPPYVVRSDDGILIHFNNVLYLTDERALEECLK